MLRTLTIGALLTVALALGACGDSESNNDLPAAVPAGAEQPMSAQTATTPAGPPTAPAKNGRISSDLSRKPEIPKPSGKPPTKLVVKDIVKGKGKAAKTGDTVTVHYVGVANSTGQEFDASYGGEPAEFALVKNQLIDGWVEGIPGMKVGGRRELIIPSKLAYGADGRPPAIGPDEALTFVIDLKKVG
jgi:peptidylprolyl isomerase